MRNVTFNERVKEALEVYGITASDLAKLIGSNSSNVKNIIEGKVGIGSLKMELISEVFGLKYYEFGNPEIEFLPVDRLENKVQKVIQERKKVGVLLRDKSNSLANELDRLIEDGEFNVPITASRAFSKMNLTGTNKNSSLVTNLLSKRPRNLQIYRLDNDMIKNIIFIHKDFYEKYKGLTDSELLGIIEK
ncbi:helix-turn-helix transcriptional regulator [Myroides odoratimimus]|uniref:helix-turn-helix domain-containing protein n=1 Tax=Myroides odoratimimus TaxID=76832 RepID=UPI0025779C28|nr:helix-turn-helix transcriptional regulator [Myroides odoratimimus]MDM1412128.1 helix-turn-helix transcriptional regulator [Myroides odoratimimus]